MSRFRKMAAALVAALAASVFLVSATSGMLADTGICTLEVMRIFVGGEPYIVGLCPTNNCISGHCVKQYTFNPYSESCACDGTIDEAPPCAGYYEPDFVGPPTLDDYVCYRIWCLSPCDKITEVEVPNSPGLKALCYCPGS